MLGDRHRVVVARVAHAEATAEIDLVDGRRRPRARSRRRARPRGRSRPRNRRAGRSASRCARAGRRNAPRRRRRCAPRRRAPSRRRSAVRTSSRPRRWRGTRACARRRRGSRARAPTAARALVAHEMLDAVELVVAVDHDVLHAGLQRGAQLVESTCCCRARTTRPAGKPAREHHMQLAARRHVDVEPFLVDDAGRSRCTGRPCSRRPRRHESSSRTRGSGGGSRPRRTRTAACRSARRARRGRNRRSTAGPARRRAADRGNNDRSIGVAASIVRLTASSSIVESGHRLGRVHAEHAQRVGEPDPAGLDEPEPGRRERRFDVDHPARAVERVERAGEIVRPVRDLVRRTGSGRVGERVRDSPRACAAARARGRR